jgi:guanylate kinase
MSSERPKSSASTDAATRTRGLLFIVSAPSGTGKTTLVERLVQILPNLRMSRSYTSRPARVGERDGLDYNFISRDAFEQRIRASQFLEWADVFGNYYGTGIADVENTVSAGQDVVLVIDVQGARQVKAQGVDHTAIFVMPPSFEVLEQRLRGRSKDIDEADIQRRLDTARAEVSSYVDYDYVVVNDELEPTVVRLQEIIAAERSRTHRMKSVAQQILHTFRSCR